MKRATREHIANLSIGATYTSDRAVWLDVLDSDDRQREELHRLREELHRLREVLKRIAADACGDPCPDYSMCDGCQARAVLKNWRKP